VAVCALDKRNSLDSNRMRYESRSRDCVVFVEQYARNEVEMHAAKVPNGREVPGVVINA
jgi:hypothetical protein